MFLYKEKMLELLVRDKDPLVIKPLLDEKQIGELTIDMRLGNNFLVTVQGRSPFIDASLNHQDHYPISTFFQETRRVLGETFLFHPGQSVLSSSLEYVKMPKDVFAEVNMRSSYLRLGLTLSSIVQPGYCGCVSIEITNTSKSPINLTVGAPIIQLRLYQLDKELNYFSSNRKYLCQVRPILSAIKEDGDLKSLHDVWRRNNHK